MKYDPNTLTVTSANRKIMKDYGKDTLPTIIKNSPGDVLVCYDGKEPDIIEGDWVRMLSLDNDKELKSFVERNKGTEGNGFRYDAVKFAWKVFSLYHGFKIAQQTEKEHLIWCDADTYITDKITNVEEIDPVFGIDDTKYVSYMPDSIGQKVLVVSESKLEGGKKVIDMAEQDKGSDLWLFWQAVAHDTVVPFVSAQGPASLYAKMEDSKLVVEKINGEDNVEFSLRLIGTRLDHTETDNLYHDQDVENYLDINKLRE